RFRAAAPSKTRRYSTRRTSPWHPAPVHSPTLTARQWQPYGCGAPLRREGEVTAPAKVARAALSRIRGLAEALRRRLTCLLSGSQWSPRGRLAKEKAASLVALCACAWVTQAPSVRDRLVVARHVAMCASAGSCGSGSAGRDCGPVALP